MSSLLGVALYGPAFVAATGAEIGKRPAPEPPAARVRVWIDTDIGGDIDDALCLLCAVRHPRIELVGVSTVQGCIGSIRAAAWVARTLLDKSGLKSVPVLPGSRARLDGGGAYDDRGSYGVLAPEFPPLPATPEADNARIDAIAETMRGVNAPFYLVAVGPLSNVARLVLRHPDVVKRWRGVVCMAGTLRNEAECNVRLDAGAARVVVEKCRPRFVGAEAMGRAIPLQLVEKAASRTDPASAFFLECYRRYRIHTARKGESPDKRALTISDAVTLLSLVRPDLYRIEPMRIVVENDGRLRRSPAGGAMEFTRWSNHAEVEKLLLDLLRGRRR